MDKKYLQIEDKNIESLKGERAIVHYISTNDIDRTRDIMNPKGMDSTDFMKSGTVFFNHNYNQPIAKNIELQVKSNGIKAKTVFSNSKFADDIYQLHLEGIINTWSIGFTAKQEDVMIDDKTGVWTYRKWNLIEYSSAPLPANPNALDSAKSIMKSIEGIAMIDSELKHYELNSLITKQSKELTEIKDLIKNLGKSETNEDLKKEIQKEFENILENLKTEINKNINLQIETTNKTLSGVKSDLLNKFKTNKVSDLELAKTLTGEIMKGVNSQIARAFLQVTGKEIKL